MSITSFDHERSRTCEDHTLENRKVRPASDRFAHPGSSACRRCGSTSLEAYGPNHSKPEKLRFAGFSFIESAARRSLTISSRSSPNHWITGPVYSPTAISWIEEGGCSDWSTIISSHPTHIDGITNRSASDSSATFDKKSPPPHSSRAASSSLHGCCDGIPRP